MSSQRAYIAYLLLLGAGFIFGYSLKSNSGWAWIALIPAFAGWGVMRWEEWKKDE